MAAEGEKAVLEAGRVVESVGVAKAVVVVEWVALRVGKRAGVTAAVMEEVMAAAVAKAGRAVVARGAVTAVVATAAEWVGVGKEVATVAVEMAAGVMAVGTVEALAAVVRVAGAEEMVAGVAVAMAQESLVAARVGREVTVVTSAEYPAVAARPAAAARKAVVVKTGEIDTATRCSPPRAVLEARVVRVTVEAVRGAVKLVAGLVEATVVAA